MQHLDHMCDERNRGCLCGYSSVKCRDAGVDGWEGRATASGSPSANGPAVPGSRGTETWERGGKMRILWWYAQNLMLRM